MKLELRHVRLRRPGFALEIDAVLEGRIAAFFGPSGAGKTTLLDLVAGLERPDAGAVSLDGTVLADVAAGRFVPSRARAVGYVPQDQALFPHLSVRGNLLFGAGAAENSQFSLTHVCAALEIADLLDRGVRALSGGEKQRVALGRALLSKPRLLLLDEPLAGLDAALKTRTLELLRRIHAEFGVPILYVTHAAEEIVSLCDEVVILERGRVVRQGAPGQVFEPAHVQMLRVRP